MNKKLSYAILLIFILFQHNAWGQDEFKFGKVSEEELKMTHYQADTSAIAVCLFKDGKTQFTYNAVAGEFGTESDYVFRIKILKPEGKKYADVSIPFFYNEKQNGIRDRIVGIKAVSYTLVDGKIKESELSKKYIFEEKSSGNWRVVKFSIPNVEEGSVIEYKYTYLSNDAFHLDSWNIQQGIPVKYAKYKIQIPEYFKFKADTKGYENITTERGSSLCSFNAGTNSSLTTLPCYDWTFTATDIPAAKDEPFLWCIDDYLSSVDFELDGIDFPGGGYKNYSTSWEEIKNTLKNYEGFGEFMDLENPFREDMVTKNVTALPFEDKVQAILGILKDKLKWNKEYRLFGKDIKETLKQGSGSNANLNFILMAMLRDAGVVNKPILLRTRSEGRLPYRATMDKLNTFIVAAYDPEGKAYYLDGSIEHGALNVLPSLLMPSQAIVFDESIPTQFVDLSKVGRHMLVQTVQVNLHPDGTFEGTRQNVYVGQLASDFKRKMSNEEDSLSTMQKTEEEYNIVIKACETSQTARLGEKCQETLYFSGEMLTSDDRIYLNPMIFPDETEQPFTNVSRKFPVEFPYAQTVQVNVSLTLPEGYQVEELPQSAQSTMNQNELMYSYIIRQVGDKINLRYRSVINTPLILPEQYEELRSFWEDMVNRNNQQLVLKKITQP